MILIEKDWENRSAAYRQLNAYSARLFECVSVELNCIHIDLRGHIVESTEQSCRYSCMYHWCLIHAFDGRLSKHLLLLIRPSILPSFSTSFSRIFIILNIYLTLSFLSSYHPSLLPLSLTCFILFLAKILCGWYWGTASNKPSGTFSSLLFIAPRYAKSEGRPHDYCRINHRYQSRVIKRHLKCSIYRITCYGLH